MNPRINFNTNYRRELKFVPINMYYCLLQFDTLKIVLRVHLHRVLDTANNVYHFVVKFWGLH